MKVRHSDDTGQILHQESTKYTLFIADLNDKACVKKLVDHAYRRFEVWKRNACRITPYTHPYGFVLWNIPLLTCLSSSNLRIDAPHCPHHWHHYLTPDHLTPWGFPTLALIFFG